MVLLYVGVWTTADCDVYLGTLNGQACPHDVSMIEHPDPARKAVSRRMMTDDTHG